MKPSEPTPDMLSAGTRWYGGVPSGWDVRRFKHVAAIRMGQVDPRLPGYRDLPLFAPNHVESGTGRLLEEDSAAEQGAESGKYLVDAGDVLYAKIRPALRKVAIAPRRGLCSADMYPIKCSASMSSRFLFWALLSEGFYRYSLLESDRVAMPKINRESLGECPLPVPPLPVQRAIADFLDRKTRAIDELIRKKERLIELHQEKRQALITQAVTKGLDPNVPMRDSGVPWLGEIPVHWDVRRLRFLRAGPLQYGANEAANLDDPDLPRFIRITDIASDGSLRSDTFRSLPEDVAQPYLLNEGDLLLARSGATVGKAFIYRGEWGRACFAGYLIRLRCDCKRITPAFLHAYTQSAPYWAEVGLASIQATIENVSAERYNDFAVACPPLGEQDRIVAELDRNLRQISVISDAVMLQTDRLREYRQAFISAAVTGQIDVGTATRTNASAGEDVAAL